MSIFPQTLVNRNVRSFTAVVSVPTVASGGACRARGPNYEGRTPRRTRRLFVQNLVFFLFKKKEMFFFEVPVEKKIKVFLRFDQLIVA